MKKHYLLPAAIYVSNETAEISTLLGSCVAVCLWDPLLKSGGMNHFLLPLWNGEGLPSPKYGNVAIPKLIERMIETGSQKYNITAKVFGGGAVLQVADNMSRFLNVGQRNIDIAFETLKKENIKVKNYDVGGNTGRKLIMSTNDFKIRMKRIKKTEVPA